MKISVIILAFVVLIIGFIKNFRLYKKILEKYNFAFDFREKFIDFADEYFRSFDTFSRRGNFDSDLYIWLTKNANKIQINLGRTGIMSYMAPFQRYTISNYQIVINSLPKFRDGTIDNSEVNYVDDCLLRYMGDKEEQIKSLNKNLKNPIIWFRSGIYEIVSIPLIVLNWFGIFSKKTIDKITGSTFYRVLTGIIAMISLVSGVITIIMGKEHIIGIISKFFK